MGKVKLIKNNKKSVFMLISMMFFSFVILIYSILIMFSPIVSSTNFETVNSYYNSSTDGSYKSVFGLFWTKDKVITIALNKVWIFWFPLVFSCIGISITFSRLIIHLIGYKTKYKNGVIHIIKPIKSYQITMYLLWILLVVLTTITTLSILSALPFFVGVVLNFSLSNFVSIDLYASQWCIDSLNGQFSQIYWPSYSLFSDLLLTVNEINSLQSSTILWSIILPLLLPFLSGIVAFSGAICGECSWWSINLIVLKDIDLQTGSKLVANYQKIKKLKIKDKKDREIERKIAIGNNHINKDKDIIPEYDQKLINKCKLYYKNLIKMLVDSKNEDSIIFKNVVEKVELIKKTENVDWNVIAEEIKEQINLLTVTDKRFVDLIEELLINPRISLFGRYKGDLEELIEGYNKALKAWDLFETEVKLEQIFAITFRNEELLPKVGYCLKNRVNSNWKNIEDRENFVIKLEDAKKDRDFTKYREICTEMIKEMSPIKPIIVNYVKKIIYN